MYQVIFYVHIVVSVISLVLGLSSLTIATNGLLKGKEYTQRDKVLGKLYVMALYSQLALGLIMYFYPWSDKVLLESSAIDPGNSPTIRFWEIEHVAIMVFALFLVQIGCIFVSNTKSSKRKFRLILFYFGIPLILMVFSMIMSMR